MRLASFFLRLTPLAYATNLPFVLTLCDTAVSGPDSFCPDGFTLTIAGSAAVLESLKQIAPSQYQANWRRSGGVITGGPAVALLREEIIPSLGQNLVQWLDGFDVANATNWQPPIPLDFVSEVAISQKQYTLPAFAWPWSDRKLSSFPYPVWQIFHAPWKRAFMKEEALDPSFILQGIIVRLRESEPEIRRESLLTESKEAAQIYGIRLYGYTTKGLRTWELLREDHAVSDGDSINLRLERALRMTGLTFSLDTAISLESNQTKLTFTKECEIALDQLLPSSIFLDMDEANYHTKFTDAQYVTPQYHDIELPAHLATPVVYRTRFQMIKGKNLYQDDNLILHDRYNIRYGTEMGQGDLYTALELQPPSATIVCTHARSNNLRIFKGVFNSIESAPASSGNPYALIVRGMVIDASYEVHAAIITSITLVIAVICVLQRLLPVLLQASKLHED